MAYSENLFDIIAFGKCEDPYTKNEYSSCTTIILYIKPEAPGADSHFWPPRHDLNTLGSGPYIKYQGSRPCGFRHEDYSP